MKTKLLTLCAVLLWVGSTIAGNKITYTAAEKLQTTSTTGSGLHTNAFNVSISSHTFSYSSGQGTITFSDEVTSIGDYAFYGCSGLTSVTIPNSVTSIGDYAFRGCSGLTSVTIPNSVTSIGANAFEYCSGLTSVTIPNSVTSIEEYTFYGCSGLTSVTIPNSVTSIGKSAFGSCSGLTSVTIPNSVTSIGADAFAGCSGLTSVTIPNSVTSIGAHAFAGCSGLTSVTIPNSVTSIGANAFEYCSGLTSVTIGNSVTSIEKYTFIGCTKLTSITIGNSVTSFGLYAFGEGENNIKSVQWNAINCETFNFGSQVENFTFGNSVEVIPNAVCSRMRKLTSITIPNSVTSIGAGAFGGCSGLTSSITIPNSVTSIGESAFAGCSGLTSVTIPNSVTSIGAHAFAGCSGLTSVTIPNSVTSIEEYTFADCSGLTSVTIPNSVTSIGGYAFRGCSGLPSVTIPSSVTKIRDYAFDKCNHLYDITCLAMNPPIVVENAFYNYNVYLHVPCSSLRYYSVDGVWGKFTNVECVSAELSSTGKFEVIPAETDATFTWPMVSNAEEYTLGISKDGEVVSRLIFNANGQLNSITYAPKNKNVNQDANQAAAGGFKFKVVGLTAASKYTYTFVATSAQGNVVDSYNGVFYTKGYTAHNALDVVTIEGLRVEAGLIVYAGDFRIYNMLGHDVTHLNGKLQGIYIVKTENATQKVIVR